jgi:hypothetical protein
MFPACWTLGSRSLDARITRSMVPTFGWLLLFAWSAGMIGDPDLTTRGQQSASELRQWRPARSVMTPRHG